VSVVVCFAIALGVIDFVAAFDRTMLWIRLDDQRIAVPPIALVVYVAIALAVVWIGAAFNRATDPPDNAYLSRANLFCAIQPHIVSVTKAASAC
jgi:hypothetical protein